VGLEDEQVNQDLEGEGVGSGERRKGQLWNEKIRESSFLRVAKLAISVFLLSRSVAQLQDMLKLSAIDAKDSYKS